MATWIEMNRRVVRGVAAIMGVALLAAPAACGDNRPARGAQSTPSPAASAMSPANTPAAAPVRTNTAGANTVAEPSPADIPPASAAQPTPSAPPDYIIEAHWEDAAEGPTLVVTPSEAARAAVGSFQAGVDGWDQLVSRYPDPRLDEAASRMRYQYICHQQFATIDEPDKPTWDLELDRPDVGYTETVAARCNP